MREEVSGTVRVHCRRFLEDTEKGALEKIRIVVSTSEADQNKTLHTLLHSR